MILLPYATAAVLGFTTMVCLYVIAAKNTEIERLRDHVADLAQQVLAYKPRPRKTMGPTINAVPRYNHNGKTRFDFDLGGKKISICVDHVALLVDGHCPECNPQGVTDEEFEKYRKDLQKKVRRAV